MWINSGEVRDSNNLRDVPEQHELHKFLCELKLFMLLEGKMS